MRLEDLLFNQEGTCPVCGGQMINYDSIELGDCDRVYYPCECEKCGATWNEVYEISFISVDDVRDENGKDLYNSYEDTKL